MGRARIAGLIAVAALTTGAAGASSAWALPEFSGPFSKPFTATSAWSLLETKSGKKTKCSADTATGEITGPQSGTIQITFTGCKFGKTPCNTPAAPSGTIITSLLQIRVGYISAPKKTVGADLYEPVGNQITSYVCGTAVLGVKVTGSVIGRLTPTNKAVVPAKVFKLKFQQTAGVQEVPNLESGPVDILESSFGPPPEVTGLKSTESLLFTEPVTLSA